MVKEKNHAGREKLPPKLEEVISALAKNRSRPQRRFSNADCGIYALYLHGEARLPGLDTRAEGPVYVGMTEDGLDIRYHFGHKDSSFSSPRRSLGALLREKLSLTALPRGSGRARKDMSNFRFSAAGEEALTEWMLSNLDYSFVSLEGSIPEVEKVLIRRLEPPLNLTGWANPQRPAIKEWRKQCAEEAAKSKAASPKRQPPGTLSQIEKTWSRC